MPDDWLDSNVFIEGKKGPYSFDIAPRFWSLVDELTDAGRISCPVRVYEELLDGQDDLSDWAKARRPSGLFLEPSTAVQEAFRHITACVNAPLVSIRRFVPTRPTPWENEKALVRHRLNLTVRDGVTARRVMFEGTRAVGIEAESGGDVFIIEGDEIVLCAGGIASPQLLMLSGIGPAGQLRELGIPEVLDSPGVGQNLRDHPMAMLDLEPREGASLAEEAPRIQTGLRYTAGPVVVLRRWLGFGQVYLPGQTGGQDSKSQGIGGLEALLQPVTAGGGLPGIDHAIGAAGQVLSLVGLVGVEDPGGQFQARVLPGDRRWAKTSG